MKQIFLQLTQVFELRRHVQGQLSGVYETGSHHSHHCRRETLFPRTSKVMEKDWFCVIALVGSRVSLLFSSVFLRFYLKLGVTEFEISRACLAVREQDNALNCELFYLYVSSTHFTPKGWPGPKFRYCGLGSPLYFQGPSKPARLHYKKALFGKCFYILENKFDNIFNKKNFFRKFSENKLFSNLMF